MTCSKNEASVSVAAGFLRRGKICILPTDTVYGFSGIAEWSGEQKFCTDEKIRSIKGRAEEKPLIQLVCDPDEIAQYASCEIPPALKRKWPGALTVIVPVKAGIPFAKKCPSVAFRCPGDSWLRAVIRECGAPVYSTSVNRSGSPALGTLYEIEREFGAEVDLIVDGGCASGSLPSTLVQLRDSGWTVLRQGAVSV